MKVIPNAGLIFLVVVSSNMVIGNMSVRHAQLCGGNSTTNQVTCPSESVISIIEDTLKVCYKEHCGQKQNIYGRIKTTLWEKCHGKEECTLTENDVTSVCFSEGNTLNFAYRCVDLKLKSNHGINVQLGLGSYGNIKANKEIHVRSSDYPNDMRGRGQGYTYSCSFRNRGGIQENLLFLRFNRVSLAEDSQLQIKIDDNMYLSLVKKGDDHLLGQHNCNHVSYNNTFKIIYRQCYRNTNAIQGSMWITIRASTSLNMTCKNVGTGPPDCSWEKNGNVCIARKVDFSSDNGTVCNCSNDAHPASTPGGTDNAIFAVIIIGVILLIGVIVCVIVCLIRKVRNNREQEHENDNIYSDTAFSPVNREPMEANLYTEIDLPSSSHYDNIDPSPSVPLGNTENSSALPDPTVQYGFVNKPLKMKGVRDREEHKMLENVIDGCMEAEEDETVMQENTELYS